MTFRAKPAVKGPGRSGWNSEDGRTRLVNLGFVIAIAVSILILIGYAAWSFYDDHLGAAATVNGTVITRDQLRTRVGIESFRINYTEARLRTLLTAQRISEASYNSQVQFLEQRRGSIASIALERLIDQTIQEQLAAQEGVSVTDAEIDAQLLDEATVPEERHAWVIEIAPENDPATGEPGPAQITAARAKASKALADLRDGTPWEDVASAASTGASAAQNGDLGWLPKESGYDEAFMAAIFDLQQVGITDVITGDDGTLRIGRITEIAPAMVDETYAIQRDDAGVKLEDYRQAVRGDLIRTGLDDKIVADLSKPSLQRHVLQILLTAATPVPDGVKVRHILISPKDDPNGAKDVPADDPSWKAAEDEANALYAQLQADPTQFDLLAREHSDEGAAKSTGGKLPFYDRTSGIDAAFGNAILQAGLKPGQILPPFKSSFGWHIVQFMRPYGDGNTAWMKELRTQALAGADFAQLARDQGDGAESGKGGDIGWVVAGQLGELKEVPIFATPVGGVSDVTDIPNEGTYLWKVIGVEMREPSKDQIATFKNTAFSTWYAGKKADFKIQRDSGSGLTSSQ